LFSKPLLRGNVSGWSPPEWIYSGKQSLFVCN